MLHSHLLLTSLLMASSTQPGARLVCDASAGHHGMGLRAPRHKQAAAGDRSPVPTLNPGQPERTDVSPPCSKQSRPHSFCGDQQGVLSLASRGKSSSPEAALDYRAPRNCAASEDAGRPPQPWGGRLTSQPLSLPSQVQATAGFRTASTTYGTGTTIWHCQRLCILLAWKRRDAANFTTKITHISVSK